MTRAKAIRQQDKSAFDKVFLISFALAGICLFVFYIFQINTVISESYQIQSSYKQLENLRQENKLAEVNFLKTYSLENIEQMVNALNFEKIAKTDHIHVLDGQVVVK